MSAVYSKAELLQLDLDLTSGVVGAVPFHKLEGEQRLIRMDLLIRVMEDRDEEEMHNAWIKMVRCPNFKNHWYASHCNLCCLCSTSKKESAGPVIVSDAVNALEAMPVGQLLKLARMTPQEANGLGLEVADLAFAALCGGDRAASKKHWDECSTRALKRAGLTDEQIKGLDLGAVREYAAGKAPRVLVIGDRWDYLSPGCDCGNCWDDNASEWPECSSETSD